MPPCRAVRALQTAIPVRRDAPTTQVWTTYRGDAESSRIDASARATVRQVEQRAFIPIYIANLPATFRDFQYKKHGVWYDIGIGRVVQPP